MRFDKLCFVTLFAFSLSACKDEQRREPVTLAKNDRLSGGAEFNGVATFYGYVDNRAACEEIAKILNRHPEEFDGMIANEFKCL